MVQGSEKFEQFIRPDTVKSYYYCYDPFLGYRLSPCYRKEGFTINTAGYRSSKEYSEHRTTGLQRVLVFGDSQTMGAHVRDEETFCERLEKELGDFEVFNMGVAGYGVDQQLLSFCREGPRYRPDIVVMAVYVDDFARAQLSFRTYGKPKFILKKERLVLTNIPVPLPDYYESFREKLAWYRQSTILDKIRFRIHSLCQAMEKDVFAVDMTILQLGEKILEKFLEQCQLLMSRMILVVIPQPGMFCMEQQIRSNEEDFMAVWARNHAVPVVDFGRDFEGAPHQIRKRQFLENDGVYHHLSPQGHLEISRRLAVIIRASENKN